jgi:hypothetical protein
MAGAAGKRLCPAYSPLVRWQLVVPQEGYMFKQDVYRQGRPCILCTLSNGVSTINLAVASTATQPLAASKYSRHWKTLEMKLTVGPMYEPNHSFSHRRLFCTKKSASTVPQTSYPAPHFVYVHLE